MANLFRIHGDNIVECERIAKIILGEVDPVSVRKELVSPSTLSYTFDFHYLGYSFSWQLELLPGFNKSGRRRWSGDIFEALRDNGSFIDETPDAIITKVNNGKETILCAIEFCSALQAGNQAWQRSGRAFSTGRTGCPYLYIVDFVKYELDSKTRQRKALRYPNPAVPYSFINFSRVTGNFVAQIYVQSEEFDKNCDNSLASFDENDFAEGELSAYIVKRMGGLDTAYEEALILRKNLDIVTFLADSDQTTNNLKLTESQWRELYDNGQGIVDYSKENANFVFHKKIAKKGHHGHTQQLLDLIDDCSVGLASRDLPFGIIPADKRPAFSRGLGQLYPSFSETILRRIGVSQNDLILCLIKGFKPGGDDNRPDRGVLPLAVMLTNTDVEIMTFIYGPIIERNYSLLTTTPRQLADSNGLWQSVLGLSNYVAIDAPIKTRRNTYDAELLLDTSDLKAAYNDMGNIDRLCRPVFSSIPQEYHEDDVDTGIHYLFSHLLGENCFEGMCNPPGGDWSGLSIIYRDKEVRWLSLPRVSDDIDGKRPDHVLELFGVYEKPVLLSIESKEKSRDLEVNVGVDLLNYIERLMEFVPSVERRCSPSVGNWSRSADRIHFEEFEAISAAAYLRSASQPSRIVFNNSHCDMLFILAQTMRGWDIEIITNTPKAEQLKAFIIEAVEETGNEEINLR